MVLDIQILKILPLIRSGKPLVSPGMISLQQAIPQNSPQPSAYCYILLMLQPEGKKPMSSHDFLLGHKVTEGERIG